MKNKIIRRQNIWIVLLIFVISCHSEEDYLVDLYEEGEEFLTGEFGVNSVSSNAFGFEIEGLTLVESASFATGDSLFNQSWVSSPASTTARDGLGPTFNARACTKCHFKDGRGSPLVNGEVSAGFLMRLSLVGKGDNNSPKQVPGYGNQLQDRANLRVSPEGVARVTYENIKGTYPDGTPYELRKPIYSFSKLQFGSLHGVLTSPRVAQQTIGMGFIDAIKDNDILALADENDSDGDGISGKPNYVWDKTSQTQKLGKYGWKANVSRLKEQIASAFHGDMGLTTSLFPENNCPNLQQDCEDAPNGGTPEVSDTQLNDVLFYQATLAVPNRRNFKDKGVLQGKRLFNDIGCIGCHAIDFITGESSIYKPLGGVKIRPYSDFLLHDMGPDLADNRPDFNANGREWRTSPLWGIGLIATVNNHTFLLHDGRARNIEEAILWHGGEATTVKNNFMQLTAKERENIIAFINSL